MKWWRRMFGMAQRAVPRIEGNAFRPSPLVKTKQDAVRELEALRPDGRLVDMTHRGLGNNMQPSGGAKGEFAVWSTPRLRIGDKVKTEKGAFIAYSVEPCYDPPDMVFATFWKVEK